jgi:L-Ala-D/L-Glu epimerase
MRISSVTALPVRLHMPTAPYASADAGSKYHWGKRDRLTPKRPTPMLEYVLVRIETDDGAVGWGEAQVDIGFFGHTLEDVHSAVDDYLGPQLLGVDAFDRERLLTRIDFRGHSTAKAGIDVALHDLAARASGVSLAQLLGGTSGGRITVVLEIAGGPADAMAAECRRFVDLGVAAFKAKIGGDPDADADRLCAIREAVGPEVLLRADANQGYQVKEALRFCRLVERRDLRLDLLEQPVVEHDLDGMALLRAAVETPICADESVYSPADALRVVRRGAADVINVKIGKAGGLIAARKIAAIAEAAGVRCVFGTAFGTGIEIATKLHLAAATPHAERAVEFTELALHDTLLSEPDASLFAFPLEASGLLVPAGPGLGVALDAQTLQRVRVAGTVVA